MAKKRNARRGRGLEDLDQDDASSICSTSTSVSEFGIQPDREEDMSDSSSGLDSYIDSLYEKRATTREAGLKGLVAAFTGSVLTDFAEDKYETLLQQFISGVRRGQTTEAALACRALGLLVATVGAGDRAEHSWAEASSHLTKLAKHGSGAAARIAAIETLALLCFIAGPDGETEATLATMWSIIALKGGMTGEQKAGAATPSPALRASAISSWSLLISTLPSRLVATQLVSTSVPVLSKLLKDSDLGVRTTAGEAIALLYETAAGFSAKEGEVSEGESDSDDSCLDEASENGPVTQPSQPLGDKQSTVIDAMRELSVQGTKRRSKREQVAQRSSFRELVTLVQDGSCSTTKVKLKHGDSLTIDTWSQTVQLKVLRKFLAEGFQAHLQENPLLHEVFGFQPRVEASAKLSNREKRMYRSSNSATAKARTQYMSKVRGQAQAGNFFGGGGDSD